jgi:hypothetical protein
VDDTGIERAVAVGVLAVAALVGTALVSQGRETTRAPSVEVAAPVTTVVSIPAPTTTRVAASPVTTTTVAATTTTVSAVDPGALPQTDQRPTASGPMFTAGVDGLWQAVRDDRPDLGMAFFFPKAAYLQVKAISDPATDYQQRLIAHYEQDIHALHTQLGADPSSAQFTGIDVPDTQAVFVQPGEESNKLSYWRVYGTTLHFTVNGQSNSFPVTSLISWRGEWYVVHLGAIR